MLEKDTRVNDALYTNCPDFAEEPVDAPQSALPGCLAYVPKWARRMFLDPLGAMEAHLDEHAEEDTAVETLKAGDIRFIVCGDEIKAIEILSAKDPEMLKIKMTGSGHIRDDDQYFVPRRLILPYTLDNKITLDHYDWEFQFDGTTSVVSLCHLVPKQEGGWDTITRNLSVSDVDSPQVFSIDGIKFQSSEEVSGVTMGGYSHLQKVQVEDNGHFVPGHIVGCLKKVLWHDDEEHDPRWVKINDDSRYEQIFLVEVEGGYIKLYSSNDLDRMGNTSEMYRGKQVIVRDVIGDFVHRTVSSMRADGALIYRDKTPPGGRLPHPVTITDEDLAPFQLGDQVVTGDGSMVVRLCAFRSAVDNGSAEVRIVGESNCGTPHESKINRWVSYDSLMLMIGEKNPASLR